MNSSRHLALVLSLLAAGASTLGHAQEDAATAWRTFQRSQPNPWRVVWNDATGTPESIYGPGLPLGEAVTSLPAARAHAEHLLRERRALLGTGESRFVENIGVKVLQTYVFVYTQEHAGLEVIGGRADVRIHERGVVSLFGSRRIPVPADLSLVPTLTNEAAREVALRSLELTAAMAEPNPRGDRLVLFGDPDAMTPVTARLAWEIEVRAHLENVEGHAYVDAHTGDVITYRSAIHTCATCEARRSMPTNVTGNVQGWTNVDKLPNAALVNVPMQGMKVQIIGGGFAYCDANGDFDISHTGTTPLSVRVTMEGEYLTSMTAEQGTLYAQTFTATPGVPLSVQIFTSNPVEFDRSQTTTFWHIDQVNRFVQGFLGPLPALINGVRANVNRSAQCNATYNTIGNVVTFYNASGGCPNTAYNSVITHEWGHGLDDAFGGINQNDGQSEGSADIVSILYNDDPIIGPDFLGPGMPVRTALNTLTYPQGGSVHQMGEPWMGWCWDVRQGLGGTLGSAAGLQRARELFLGVFTTNPSSHPNAVLNVFVLDDNDGNLDNGTPNYDVLAFSATNRHFPYPQRLSGTFEIFGSGCAGTGDAHVTCLELNPNETTARQSTQRPFLVQVQATQAATLHGFDLLTGSTNGFPQTVRTYYHRQVGTAPAPQPEQSSSMVVVRDVGFYRTTFQPFQVAAGETFYIGFDGIQYVYTPQTQAGSGSAYYLDLGFGWFGPFTNPMSWRLVCQGSGGGATPLIGATSIPEIGQAFEVLIDQAAPNATAVLFLGASDQIALGIPLPFDLGPLGAAGCSILSSLELTTAGVTSTYGSSQVTLSIPNDTSLLWTAFFQQWVVLDPAANALGVAVTAGGRAVIGQ
ncbi:MAG: hypothetical protein H6833_10870 [Planctomycetes bacterium]|nr:hypothetical protein [Planctomycetota bacterium]